MALVKAVTLDSGIELPEAYHKITWFCGGTVSDNLEIDILVFKDKAARDEGKQPATNKRVSVAINLESVGNIFTILYTALKTHPDYEDAIDQM